jgi:uncharacterized membrane protein
MFCTQCGTHIEGDPQFCPNCGKSCAPEPVAAQVVFTPALGITAQTGRWISEGWRMVTADIGFFLLVALIFAVVGSAVPLILQGPMLAGFHLICAKKLFNRKPELADLFKGFNYFVPALVASILIGLLVSVGFMLCIIPGLVLVAMFQFTYLFIVDKRMDFWPAMQASHAVIKNDYAGFTIFVTVLGLIHLAGILCCIVGVFVAMPVAIAATTVAYKEIVGFEPRTAETL